MKCWFSDKPGPCSGRLDPHHLLKQQVIRRRFPFGAVVEGNTRRPLDRRERLDDLKLIPLEEILSDDRNIRPVCRVGRRKLSGC